MGKTESNVKQSRRKLFVIEAKLEVKHSLVKWAEKSFEIEIVWCALRGSSFAGCKDGAAHQDANGTFFALQFAI